MPWLDATDFFQPEDHALHPLAVGGCMIITACIYLRLTSNRTLSPISIYDWILSVTFGSTLSRIITQPDLTYFRGFLALMIIALFEYIPSLISVHSPSTDYILRKQPLCVVFRGEFLEKVARSNRVGKRDVLRTLRVRGMSRLADCEAVVLEGTGVFSVIARLPESDDIPDTLCNVKGYVDLWHAARQQAEKQAEKQGA